MTIFILLPTGLLELFEYKSKNVFEELIHRQVKQVWVEKISTGYHKVGNLDYSRPFLFITENYCWVGSSKSIPERRIFDALLVFLFPFKKETS